MGHWTSSRPGSIPARAVRPRGRQSVMAKPPGRAMRKACFFSNIWCGGCVVALFGVHRITHTLRHPLYHDTDRPTSECRAATSAHPRATASAAFSVRRMKLVGGQAPLFCGASCMHGGMMKVGEMALFSMEARAGQGRGMCGIAWKETIPTTTKRTHPRRRRRGGSPPPPLGRGRGCATRPLPARCGRASAAVAPKLAAVVVWVGRCEDG